MFKLFKCSTCSLSDRFFSELEQCQPKSEQFEHVNNLNKIMLDQWFGKPFWFTLGALVGGFLLSIAVFHNLGEGIFLAVAGLGVLALTIWRLEYGLLAAFAELFANSHGHLVSTEVFGFDLSLREVIFLGVMLGWLVLLVTRKTKLQIKDNRILIFLPLFLAIVIGYAVGFAQNEAGKAFNDGNGYFYLAYLFPILSVKWDLIKQRQLLQVMAAAAIWVTALTLGLLYLFTHLSGEALVSIYRFIRDTRTGELTRMSGVIFRIFLQAQFSAIIFALLIAPWLWLKEISKKTRIHLVFILALLISVALISLSRSFWVGLIVAAVPFIVLIISLLKPTVKRFASSSGLAITSGIAATIILAVVTLFPIPYRLGSLTDLTWLFSSRTSDLGDVAISSRWNLLPEMWEEIKTAPLLGSGFGEEVTFKTDDPRARSISPDGTWTTYAFEWGWLDLWLKMGLLGPLAFLWLFYGLLKGLLRDEVRLERNPSEVELSSTKVDKSRPAWLTIGLVSGLFMLYATHIFSPYLNHPLGLGFILFLVPFINFSLAQRKVTKETLPLYLRPSTKAVEPSSAAWLANSLADSVEQK